MKKIVFSLISIFTLVCLSVFIFCDKDEEVIEGTVVGLWEERINKTEPFVPETLSVKINIEDIDSTFELNVIGIETGNDLYYHGGTWEIKAGVVARADEYSLFLYGDSCAAIDSITNLLVTLPDSICMQTVELDTSRTSDDKWEIKIEDIAPYMESLLDSSTIEALKAMNFTLYMERQ